MAEWLYLIHPPRDDFVATISPEEAEIMQVHAGHLDRLLQDGVLILAGPTFGPGENIGVAVIEAEDEEAARQIMLDDPAVTSGLMRPELVRMRVSFLRGRPEDDS